MTRELKPTREVGTVEICLDDKTWSTVVQEVEARFIAQKLTEARGNVSRAAKLAGMSRSTLRRKLALYDVQVVCRVG